MISEKLIKAKRDPLKFLLEDHELTNEINLQSKQKSNLRTKLGLLNWILDDANEVQDE